MMPIDHHMTIETGVHRQAIILLNVGDDADEAIGAIFNTTLSLLDRLSAEYLQELYTLGNSTPYARFAFHSQFDGWRRQNLHRLSLVRPILESKRPKEVDLVVILTHRVPYDLDDYACSPWQDKIVLLPVIENLGENKDEWGYLKSGFRVTGLDNVVSEINDSICKVEIGSRSMMPYSWSSTGFRWEEGQLVAEDLEDYRCCLSVLAPPDVTVSARVTYRSGHIIRELALQPASAPQARQYALSQREVNVITACVKGQSYDCPVCGGQHSKEDGIYCENRSGDELGSLLGNLIYTDLDPQIREDEKPLRFLLFIRQGAQFKAQPVWNPVLRVASNLVAHWKGTGCAQLYAYDHNRSIWQPQQRYLEQYEELSPGVYVVML